MSDAVTTFPAPSFLSGIFAKPPRLFPGVVLCLIVTFVALGLQRLEERVFGHPYVEALVLAILIGIAVRSFWSFGSKWRAGVAFSAKQLLEVAVMLLGASISFKTIIASGAALLTAVVLAVVVTICASFLISRALGLSSKLATLIACGNSICGNSAIAAVAPVIDASGDDIASSISFTAILGVLMVLGLPLLIPLLHLTPGKFGVLAGLTVYAVPQVLAATAPAGLVSTQIGTLVKLVRVLMLGPVVLTLSLMQGSRAGRKADQPFLSRIFTFVPWFIIGFLVLALLRTLDLVPSAATAPIGALASFLTVLSMAALGLGVDIRVVGRVGARVTAAVTLSLLVLLGLSLALIQILGLGANLS